jgi:Cdc6-like AAA superfamily ATPase
LYAILDLLHRRDLLFVLVGLTGRVDFSQLLDKRVSSRLNAQHVYMTQPTAVMVCDELSRRLVVPDSCVAVSQRALVAKFNASVKSLFSTEPSQRSAFSLIGAYIGKLLQCRFYIYN